MHERQAKLSTKSAIPGISGVLLTGLIFAGALWPAGALGVIAQQPLTVTRSIRPIVMLALSNDQQLYKAAYPDNIDIDNDGIIETGYDNSFEYYGYFGADLCYRYDVYSEYFVAVAEATNHQCDGASWSGNLLNWGTMTRIDLLRRVLYGGRRTTDTDAATVLERALVPPDPHAFAKVLAPEGGAAEVAKYTPYATAAITLCNVTEAPDGLSQDLDTSTYAPLVKVAAGPWQLWATGDASALHSPCAWGGESSSQQVAPVDAGGESLGSFNARTAACVGTFAESNCKRYPKPGSAKKPTGILQEFGDTKALRFGLISGSYGKSVAGGVLRRNSGFVAANSADAAADDEIDLNDGTFTGNPGIISTIESFRLANYSFAQREYTDDCLVPESGELGNGTCANWGNPVAEIVLETLRYLDGKQEPTVAFETDDSAISAALAPVTWEDPIPAEEWCSVANILAVTAGVNSFDRDDLGHDLSALDITGETNAVGAGEGISGNYVLGGNSNESDGNCYVRDIGSLSEAIGVCPAGGKLKGGWDVAGISYHAHVQDQRDDRQQEQLVSTYAIDMGEAIPSLTGIRNTSVAVGPGATITPLCMTNADPDAEVPKVRDLVDDAGNLLPRDTEPHGWAQCVLWGVMPANLQYDADGYLVEGDLYAFWEDAPFGSDSAMDAISRVHFCVGPDWCAITGDPDIDRYTLGWEDAAGGGNYTLPDQVAQDQEIRVTASVVQVYSDRTMSFGFMIDGLFRDGQPQDTADHCDNGLGSGDGIYLEEAIPGTAEIAAETDKKPKKKDVSVITGAFSIYNEDLGIASVHPERENRFCGRRFKPGDAGGDPAPLLKPPLWYASKYGGFRDVNDNGLPDLTEEWDSDGDGNPDGYHMLYAPQDIGESFSSIFDLIGGVSSSSSVVANTLVLKTGTYIYQGRFDSTDWSGDLVALEVDLDGAVRDVEWSAKQNVDRQFAAGYWDSARVVLTSNRRVDGGVSFRWDNLTETQQGLLDRNPVSGLVDALGPSRLNFVRGDRSLQLQNGGGFRDRNYLLGDIVNSDPAYVAAPPFAYPDTLELFAPYSDFEQIERDPMLYVGANDGMLHGFDAATGEERMAYVPRGVYRNLPWLTILDYVHNHRFYADGGLVAGDVVLTWWGYSGDGWHTVLVGTLGAGGKGVYALDITDPDAFSESGAAPADAVLWDATSADSGFGNLGYTIGTPAIARLRYYFGKNSEYNEIYDLGTWVAAFGNGYGSTRGSANLFLVEVGSGSIVTALEVDPGPGNGLSSVAPVDVNADDSIDYIYAGDLKGNVWRFQPTEMGTGWEVGNFGRPIFTARDEAGNVQPITTRPAVFAHPYYGHIVVFGTGKFYELADATPNPSVVHSLYGVWDRLGDSGTVTRDSLLEQEFLASGSRHGYDLRASSDYPISWYRGTGLPTGIEDPPTYLGWYLDLLTPSGDSAPVAEGELVAAELRVRGDRVIFTSMVPSTEPCDYGGESWLIEVSYLSGQRPDLILFDLDDSMAFDEADLMEVTVSNDEDGTTERVTLNANAKRSGIGIVQQPAIISDGSREYKYASGGLPAAVEVTRENPGTAAGGRASWVELR